MSNATTTYDGFFSYNWQDASAVETVARALRAQELTVFLDRWYLVPGRPWQQGLEESMEACRAVAVFLGPHGMGSWQQREIELAFARQSRDSSFPVIPVLLPGADPPLGFLALNTWVDLRSNLNDALALAVLTAAVRGVPPGPTLQERVQATLATVCPYRGLRPFREEDAPFFFGRDLFTTRLAEMVAQRPLVALVGASGSGKSSVVRAGLVPHLRRGVGRQVWDVATVVPGDRPLHALASTLVPFLEPELREVDRLAEVGKLATYLAEGRVALRDVVARVLEKQSGTDRLLLVIDQWEELYTLSREEQTTRRFLDALLDATAAGLLTVVLTLRGDFFGYALSYRPLADRLQDAVVTLGPMTRTELEQAIAAPARKVGLTFEPGLEGRLLDDVGEEPGNLPLLEFALTALWETRGEGRLRHEAYEAMGGVQGAIARRAEEMFARLTSLEQAATRRIFLQLVRPGEQTEDTGRRATFAEVGEAVRPVVHQLADARLLVTGRDPISGEETIEVAHEALIGNWARLRQWLDEDREFLLWRQRLRVAVTEWQHTQPDEGALLRGARLAEAERWLAERTDDLTPEEVRFLRESIALRGREEASKLKQARRQLVLALVGLCIAVGLAFWAIRERQRAGEAQNVAERSAQAEAGARSEAEQQRRVAVVQALAAQALRRQDELGALLARQAYLFNARGQGHELHQIDAALRAVLDTRYFSHTQHFPTAPILGKSDDRQKLIVIDKDGTIQLLDLRQLNATPTVLRGPEKPQNVRSALHPDGQTLATVYRAPTKEAGHQVLVWDLRQPQAPPTILGDDTQLFNVVAFSPDGQTLAAGTMAGRPQNRVFLWPWGQPGRVPTVLGIPESFMVSRLEFSPDSQTLATLSPSPSAMASGGRGGGTLRLWDVRHPEAAPTVFGSAEDLVVAMEFSDDGHTLATRHTESQKLSGVSMDFQKLGWESLGSTIQVRNLQQRAANPLVLRSPEASFSSMALSPDGQTLATGSSTGSVRLWDLRQPDTPSIILAPQEIQVSGLKFSPDGNILVLMDQTFSLRMWELRQSNPTFTVLRGHTDGVSSVVFSPDGHTLVSGGKDHTVRLWDLRQPDSAPTVLSDYKAPVLSVALSPDGQWLATGGSDYGNAQFDNAPWLWNLRQPHPTPAILSGPGGPVSMVAFSSNGQWLAAAAIFDIVKLPAGDSRGSVRLWEPHQPEAAPIVLDIPESMVMAVAFSPDSQHLATSSLLGPVRLWHVHQRATIRSFPGDPMHLTLSVAFSPDGQKLASGSSDGKVRLWDLRQPEADPMELPGDGVPVYTAAFSPDNQRLAMGSFSSIVRLWNLHQLEVPPIVLRGHSGPVFSVAFSPDGQRLATGSHDQTIRLWQVQTAHLADQVCERVWRNLTLDEWRQFIGADLPYERTCPNWPLHPSVLEESEKRVRAGDVDGAVAFLQRIRERDPVVEINPHKQVAQALVAQGKTLEKAGNPDGAHTLFEQARTLDPTVELHPEAKTPR